MTPAMRDALKWLNERGGSAAFAKTRAGGRVFLAQGETGPFTTGTIKKLADAGKVAYEGTRVVVK